MKLEMVTQGETEERAQAICHMLTNLLGVPEKYVVAKEQPITSVKNGAMVIGPGSWWYVYVPTRKAVMAHALIAAYKQGYQDGFHDVP